MKPIFCIDLFGLCKITIPSYALFAIIGLFVFMIYTYNHIGVLIDSFRLYIFLIVFMVIGVGIGSKLLFIITKIPHIISCFSIRHTIEVIITSGFVFYGGLIGAITGAVLFAHIQNISVRDMLNILAPGFALFHIFGRIGCFFAGCCYGIEYDWGVAMANAPDVIRIPVQLIEAAVLFIIFIVLYVLLKTNIKQNIIVLYLGMYSVCRFFLEFIRGDKLRGIWFGLSTSQWISIFIIVGLIGYYLVNKLNCLDNKIMKIMRKGGNYYGS